MAILPEKQTTQEKLESLLMQGLNSGDATEMTEEDWNKIRHEGLARLKKMKKIADPLRG